MRKILPVVVILVLILGALLWWNGRPSQPETPPETTETPAVAQPETPATVPPEDAVQAERDAAASAAADAAADAAAIAADVAAEAARATDQTDNPIADEAANAAEAAAEAALAAAARAADAAAGIAAEGEVSPSDAAESARDAAAATDEAADAALTATRIETLLTPEGFDQAELLRIIEQSNLSDAQKVTLRQVIDQAADNPELLSQALDQAGALLR